MKGGKREGAGRKTLSEELIARAVLLKKEEIAKELHNSELLDMKERGYTHEQMKDFVMPIVVKGMAEKTELSGEIKIELTTYGGDNKNSVELDTSTTPIRDTEQPSQV